MSNKIDGITANEFAVPSSTKTVSKYGDRISALLANNVLSFPQHWKDSYIPSTISRTDKPLPYEDDLLSLAMGAAGSGPQTAAKGFTTLFRGVPEWFRKKMVKEGKYVGDYMGGLNRRFNKPANKALHTTTDKALAKHYAKLMQESSSGKYVSASNPTVLEFRVPNSVIESEAVNRLARYGFPETVFKGGLSKTYLKKVHKLLDKGK
tara:strand:+ start:6231 stop:6851 length:621 start_codon:yes stop_codon:yes gene_type:complete